MTDQISSRFSSLLKAGKIKYHSVKELNDALLSPFSMSCPTTAVIAIIQGVQSDWIAIEKSKVKVLHLIDPVSPDGVNITVWCPKGTVFKAGSLLKISRIRKSHKKDGSAHLKAESDDVTEFPIFKYDYEEEEPADFFVEYQDRNICELLERWYAGVVSQTKLQDLATIVHQQTQPVIYVNLVGQPWRKRYMECSMAMTFTDGTLPSIRVKDPYNEMYAGLVDGECVDCERPGIERIEDKKFAHINIWTNESHKSNPSHHFETAHLHDLSDDWWLLFLNVEVKYNVVDDEIELNLRSGHHKGKGIRTISKSSMLGRMLLPRWENVSAGDSVPQDPEACQKE